MLQDHLFVSSTDGCLYDTRDKEWHKKDPTRKNYQRTHLAITSVSELKATLRNGAHAWPGGYPLFFMLSDGEVMSFKTATKEFRRIAESIRDKSNDGWRIVGCAINFEDDDLYDCHTNEKIECAYGEKTP